MPRRLNENNLTEKEQSFCDLYLSSGEVIQSYQESLYKCSNYKVASANAVKLLHRDRIQAYLHEKHAETSQRLEITSDRVKLEMARIALMDPKKLYNDDGSPKMMNELDADTAAAVAGLGKYGFKLWSKDKQLENLARHFNMFEDDRSAGAMKITFNDLALEKRQELRSMLDSYYLNKSQNEPKMLSEPVIEAEQAPESHEDQRN